MLLNEDHVLLNVVKTIIEDYEINFEV